jgi:hypothetical protein
MVATWTSLAVTLPPSPRPQPKTDRPAATPQADTEPIAYSSPTESSTRGKAEKARSKPRLTDVLPLELLALIASQLGVDDELAAALTCRALRAAVARSEHRAARGKLSTRIRSALLSPSVVKLEWASSCGLPMRSALLHHAAVDGRIDQMIWLRAHGCDWERPLPGKPVP